MADTTVVIFFVGLTMFSSQIPNDLGWKAVLPRVVHVDPFTQRVDHTFHTAQFQAAPTAPADVRRAPATAPAPPPPASPAGSSRFVGQSLGPQKHVEDHQSVLIFQDVAWHPSSTWPKKPLTTEPGYSYVELDGDQVRFVTQPPTGAQALNHSGLILPPLTQLCSKMSPLRKEFLPPYQGAAAVFDLANEGALSSCLSISKANQERIDSKLALTTTGRYFVVSASTMKTTKELRFDLAKVTGGTVNMYVGNIPKRFLKGDYSQVSETKLDGKPHVHAYYDMGAQASTCAQPLKTWYDAYKLNPDNPEILPCGFRFSGAGKNVVPAPIPIPGEIAPAKIGALGTQALTFECSNTQWP